MNVSIKVNEETLAAVKEAYSRYEIENNGEYVIFSANINGTKLIAYENNKKDTYKLFFNGNNALNEALKWDKSAAVKEKKPIVRKHWLDVDYQIGSDEVGTGDFFGPISVCAALIREGDDKRLKELGVDDSKKLSDEKIREIGPIVINEFEYSQVCLSPDKLNDLIDGGENMNSIKAKMHNRVLLNLRRKFPGVLHIYQDQFVEPKTYFNYLKDEKVVVRKISFKTKGESYYPSVALASVIARYSFLQKMDKLSRRFGVTIPFGASSKADLVAKEIMNKRGLETLRNIVKRNFVNYKKLIQKD